MCVHVRNVTADRFRCACVYICRFTSVCETEGIKHVHLLKNDGNDLRTSFFSVFFHDLNLGLMSYTKYLHCNVSQYLQFVLRDDAASALELAFKPRGSNILPHRRQRSCRPTIAMVSVNHRKYTFL